MLVSVIIPVYNEERTIAQIIEKVKAVNLPVGMNKEIVIVNDGSTDRTKEILSGYENQSGISIYHQANGGKTAGLLTAIKNAKGDVFLVQDADLEYDPKEYPSLLDPIVKGQTHVVYGSRFKGKIQSMKFINRFANLTSNRTINLLYGTKLTDINTCYKVFTRKSLEGIVITGTHFAFDNEFTVKVLKKGYSIHEVPIAYVARSRAEGKKIKWSTALVMFWQIIKYRFYND